MPAITGLSEATKYDLAEYCRTYRITQINWVKNHLAADRANEAATSKEEEAAK